MKINGVEREVALESDAPLLWALRDELGLTGTKFGCGIASCGACTVLVDGQPTRSCVMPIAALAGKSIHTIEGAEARKPYAAVRDAWIAEQVPQCGYCQPGMVMATVGLLEVNPAPSDADIDAAITNVCRCGTYPRIRKAIHRAAAALSKAPK
ncbi:MAG: (2Fe-2S)-binding protein [Burkholderiales bacterium]